MRPRQPSRRRKACRFCADSELTIDYKNNQMLRYYLTERSKILPARTTGLCAPHQRELTQAIKRARQIAILSYSAALY